jgi:WxcM-like, C-terminal
VITAVTGNLTLAVSDGRGWRRFDLDDAARGVYVPRMLWVDLLDFSEGAVCLVFASTIYDQSKSLRTWKSYLGAMDRPLETPRWPAFVGKRGTGNGGE